MIRLTPKEMTKLELALEEACRSMPHGGDHGLRKQIAQAILDGALNGNTNAAGTRTRNRVAKAPRSGDGLQFNQLD